MQHCKNTYIKRVWQLIYTKFHLIFHFQPITSTHRHLDEQSMQRGCRTTFCKRRCYNQSQQRRTGAFKTKELNRRPVPVRLAPKKQTPQSHTFKGTDKKKKSKVKPLKLEAELPSERSVGFSAPGAQALTQRTKTVHLDAFWAACS